MTINKSDVEWIKVPLNIQKNDSWEKYEKRLRKLLKEFDIDENESTIGWVIEFIEKKLKIINEQKNSETTEKVVEEIKKLQEKIYERVDWEIKKVLEEEEWVKEKYKMMIENEMIAKGEKSLIPKERSSHNRSVSLPPPLKLALKSDKEEELVYKIIKRRGSELMTRKEEKKTVDEKEIRIQKLEIEKENLEENAKQLERKVRYLELEKKIEKINKEITDYKSLAEVNLRVSQELVKKGIIAVDDETYLNNNRKIEEKISEHQEKAKELENELVNLGEKLETQIQVFPKIN